MNPLYADLARELAVTACVTASGTLAAIVIVALMLLGVAAICKEGADPNPTPQQRQQHNVDTVESWRPM